VRREGEDAGFDTSAAAAHFGHWDCRPDDPPCSVELAAKFLHSFEKLGYVERINGNGTFQITEKGLRESLAFRGAWL
jgi:hypothetical protein